MQTTMLWTSGVFSSARMFSPWRPAKPRAVIAAPPSENSRARYSGSAQAFATTRAPLCGPTFVS